jgi:integrase
MALAVFSGETGYDPEPSVGRASRAAQFVFQAARRGVGPALERFAQPGERGLVFAGPKGATLRRSNFRPIWNAACAQTGMPGLHFHDLRHVGGTLAAATGASPKELMARLGHSSTRAAMIYQHATRDRDQAIAKALGGLVEQVRAATASRPEEASGDA